MIRRVASGYGLVVITSGVNGAESPARRHAVSPSIIRPRGSLLLSKARIASIFSRPAPSTGTTNKFLQPRLARNSRAT